jgi:hypothetical protein
MKEIQVCSNKGPDLLQERDNFAYSIARIKLIDKSITVGNGIHHSV